MMTNDNDKLRGLWLHVDETVKVSCDACEGKGFNYICMPYSGNEPPRTGCDYCHGTGVKRVRVWGAVAPIISMCNDKVTAWLMHEGKSYCSVSKTVSSFSSNPNECFDSLVIQQPLTDAVVTAFLAKTLPGAVADHIEQEDAA